MLSQREIAAYAAAADRGIQMQAQADQLVELSQLREEHRQLRKAAESLMNFTSGAMKLNGYPDPFAAFSELRRVRELLKGPR